MLTLKVERNNLNRRVPSYHDLKNLKFEICSCKYSNKLSIATTSLVGYIEYYQRFNQFYFGIVQRQDKFPWLPKERPMNTLLLMELLAIGSLATLNIIRMITIVRHQTVVKTGVNEWTKGSKNVAVIIGFVTVPLGISTIANATTDPVVESCNSRANHANRNSVCFTMSMLLSRVLRPTTIGWLTTSAVIIKTDRTFKNLRIESD